MTAWLLWISAAIIIYAYVGYPLGIWLLSRVHPHRWKQGNIYPSVSIIVAVHNGAQLLRQQIENLLNLEYPAHLVEVLIASDGSYDKTNEILGETRHPRLKSIILPQHGGKAFALTHAINRAAGEILLFVDIRPKLEKKALRQITSNFADPEVGCVAGELCLHISDHDAGTKAMSSLYWRYEQWIRKSEVMFDSLVGVYGGFYAVRRILASALPEGLILDDMFQPLSIVRAGFRSVIDDRARAWDSWPNTAKGEFRRKVRTLAGNYQLLQLAPWLLGKTNRLRFQLISHKLVRLVLPLFLVVLLLTSYALRTTQPYAAILMGQVLFYAFSIAGLIVDTPILRRVTGPATAVVLLNTAAVVALFMFLFRRQSLPGLWVKPSASSEKEAMRAA